MNIESAKPFLNLKVTLRDLNSTAVETLPIDSVAGVPVSSATRDAYVGVKNTFLEPSALSTARLTFGSVSSSEFQDLRREFGGLSQVPYQADRSYEAVDFLPPAMQALLGRDLEIPDRASMPGTAQWELLPYGEEDKMVDLTANCHGTSWEAMQAYQGQDDLDIFFGDAFRLDGLLEDTSKFERLPSAASGNSLSTQDLRPGDLLAYYNPNSGSLSNLLHTAVYAGGGLLFEKPDTEGQEDSDAPYRLSTPEMAKKPIEAFLDGPVEIRAFRPSSPLPKPEDAFGAGLDDSVAEWQLTQGQPLGMPLLSQMEFGLGGGIRGQYVTTLVDQPVSIDHNGRGIAAG
jgi:hypothetical protein